MKRFLCFVFIFTSLFLFASCKKDVKDIEPVTRGFTCDVNIKYKETIINCELNAPGGGVFSATVKKPETLKGFKFNWNGNDFTVSFLGLEYKLDPENLPDTAFIEAIKTTLDEVGLKKSEPTVEKNGYVYEGRCDSGDYKLTVSVDGIPISLSIPSIELTATFDNFKFNN